MLNISITIYHSFMTCRMSAGRCSHLTLLPLACAPKISPSPATKKHIRVYNVQHDDQGAKLVFLGT